MSLVVSIFFVDLLSLNHWTVSFRSRRGVIVGNDHRMIYGCPLINKNGIVARIKMTTAKDVECVGTPDTDPVVNHR